jgi:deoxyadenosine/deoxycytidine kinase
MPKIFSIEGNIGSGKSTLINILRNENVNDNIVYLPEPVDTWKTIKDENNKTLLEKFYEDKKKYSFSFQMMAYISRISSLRNTIKKNSNSVIITERSVLTDKNVFAKMLFDSNYIEKVNYDIYLRWFDEFTKDITIDYIIYVKTEPSICQQRTILRNRKGEHIPLEYFKKCHKYHEEWINSLKCNVLCLDGNQNFKKEFPYSWMIKI